jgi:N-acetylmuramoyl-L-alanine amidase
MIQASLVRKSLTHACLAFLFPVLMASAPEGLTAIPSAQAAQKPFRVVLDPGHGGADEGTVYHQGRNKVSEKDVTLLLARTIARSLRTRGFEVHLTREQDASLSLSERTAMANRLKADVFISLHMNATAPGGDALARGFETYFLNSTSDESSRRLAQFENSVLGGSDVPETPEATEGNDVALILKDLRLDANLSESKRLACHLQHQLVQFTATDPSEVVSESPRNRGIRQALFYVLLGADMPAALVEAGFLKNSKDRGLVLSLEGQQKIAAALTRALERFRLLKGTSQAQQVVSNCKVH